MAIGAVKLMSATVEALYVSSRPGAIALGADSIAPGADRRSRRRGGIRVSPAREASLVAPIEAMARGRREYAARVHKLRDLSIAIALAVCAFAASRAPAVAGKPLFGYLATLLVIAASALAIPAAVDLTTRLLTRALGGMLGIEAAARIAKSVGVAAPHFRSRRRALHRDRDDDRRRHHGRQLSRNGPALDERSSPCRFVRPRRRRARSGPPSEPDPRTCRQNRAPARSRRSRSLARLRNQLRRHARRPRVRRPRHASCVSQGRFSFGPRHRRRAVGNARDECNHRQRALREQTPRPHAAIRSRCRSVAAKRRFASSTSTTTTPASVEPL